MKTLILAGGKSRRMGRDKALITRPDGTRQLDHIFTLASTLSDEISLSSNDPEINVPGIETIPDINPGDGPLGALTSFRARHPGAPLLVIGCDLFLLDEATLRQLLEGHRPDNNATCFPNRLDDRPEPLCAIYEPRALEALVNREHCARHFLESLDPRVLEPVNPVALDNANTPADLDEAFAKLSEGVTFKSITVLYFAKLREARGLDEENVETPAVTAAGLYEELRFKHRLPLELSALRCARNGDFCDWSNRLEPGDEIVFIPPVAGG